MGITQVDIKINQTNQMNGGKPKIASKSGAAVNSFDQVLAMVNLLGQTPVIDGQVNKSLLKNEANQGGGIPAEPIDTSDGEQDSAGLNFNIANTMSNPVVFPPVQGIFKPVNLEDSQSSVVDSQSDGLDSENINNLSDRVSLDQGSSLKLSEETIEQLESILTVFLNLFQEVQQTQEMNEVQSVKHMGTREIIGQSMTSPEVRNLLVRGQELMENMKQHAPVESSELLHKVTQVLGEIIDSQKNTQAIPADTDEKIQIILNELKAAQKTGVVQELLGPKPTNEMEPDPIHPNQGISLDKNQVLHTAVPRLVKVAAEVHRQSDVPMSLRSVDFTHTNGQPIFLNHQSQVSSNELKDVNQPSNLEITEFAPEVSEWISRFAKITNGKSGSTEAKFSLFPEHLGHIEIKVTTQQGQVSAQILTDTPLAKDVLEGQLQHLKQALQQSGLQVQKLDVVQQTTVSNDITQAGLGFSQDSSQSSREQRTYTNSQNNRKVQKELSEQNEHDREITPITYGGASLKTSSRIDFTA